LIVETARPVHTEFWLKRNSLTDEAQYLALACLQMGLNLGGLLL